MQETGRSYLEKAVESESSSSNSEFHMENPPPLASNQEKPLPQGSQYLANLHEMLGSGGNGGPHLQKLLICHRFLFASPFSLRTEANTQNLNDWILRTMKMLDEQGSSTFCFLLNQLWRSRNLLVFEGVVLPTEAKLEKELILSDEFWKANKKEEGRRIDDTHRNQLIEKWEAPPTTHVKVNIDTVVPRDKNGSVCIIARNEMGQILVAGT
ncbi:hypothetical protein PIB30_045592 [Stylosanthes scabra]|uniref:RNase H type-1 domain-containing protein n=1 Tax=Stylosanthes scabra TaxID=79078 RepID=A0ABU6QFL9_9FABA|nr:hypothetical protein [Stylosanthes scabra]